MASNEMAESGNDLTLEAQLRKLWSAYCWLREHDLSAQSNTSRLLHEVNIAHLHSRLVAELQELAGVLSGEHSHSTPTQDVVLEGSQVCYWTYLIALCSGIAYDQLKPHVWLAPAVRQSETRPDVQAGEINTLVASILSRKEQDLFSLLANALQAVGASCCALGVDVRSVTACDLDQMAGRPYMSAWLNSTLMTT